MTEIIKIDRYNIDKDKIQYAAGLINRGSVVAFPTETVYGLGANALDSKAVRDIFTAKGRPQDNPLIVHLSDIKDIYDLILDIPDYLGLLADVFWPGPLTIIFRRSKLIPDEITAGLDTVAIRIPSHPVALELIRSSRVPLAAPSANSSGKPSPTLASHVYEDLKGRIPLIIDSGPCDVGLESTVLDLTSGRPVILRPGKITSDDLSPYIGDVTNLSSSDNYSTPRSPGLKYKHYSPDAPMIIVEGDPEKTAEKILALCSQSLEQGKRPGILATNQTYDFYTNTNIPTICLGNRNSPSEIAAVLFDSFRKMNTYGVDIIYAEGLPPDGIGFSVMNRLRRAANNNIIILK